jgi:hypothetical protein
MPRMTGLELLEAIRRDRSAVPVIVMTAHGTVEARRLAAGHGGRWPIAQADRHQPLEVGFSCGRWPGQREDAGLVTSPESGSRESPHPAQGLHGHERRSAPGIDIRPQVEDAVLGTGVRAALVIVNCLHTTCSSSWRRQGPRNRASPPPMGSVIEKISRTATTTFAGRIVSVVTPPRTSAPAYSVPG